MKYTAPHKNLFIRNRRRFAGNMKPGAIAVFFSNDLISTSNADSIYPFQQNSSTYWLTGLDQEEITLILFPDAPRVEWKEVVFVRRTNEKIQVWEGWKYSTEEAADASGLTTVKYQEDFDTFLRGILPYCEGIYLDFNEYERNTFFTPTASHRFAERLKTEWPAAQLLRAAPILRDLRIIKSEEEQLQMRLAASITEKAFRRVLSFVKPGVWEYEIEAEIMHEFLRNRATGPAYSSIVASGKNACVLHYVLNNAQTRDGEMLLMDFGADYGNYRADLSRTIPVNGRFSPRQKDIYAACLRVFKASRACMVAGETFEGLNQKTGESMTAELLQLGLLSQERVNTQNPEMPAYKKYFMHGTSHHLGLDTHDITHRYRPFEAGMVLTCEPGIYIPEEGIGIRIENDILITEKGNEDFMGGIPIEMEEIEELMMS